MGRVPKSSPYASQTQNERQQHRTHDFSARPADLLKFSLAALVKGDDFQDDGLPSKPQLEQRF
jgi:hypothetical protein